MSILTDRARWAGLLGMMFGGQRDLYKVFGYTKIVKYSQSYGKYNRQDIVGRVIDAPADALWTKPPVVTVEGNKEWNDAWLAVAENTTLWNAIARADRLAGLGEYAALLIGMDDGGKVDMVVKGNATKVAYLQPYSIDSAQLIKLYDDPTQPNYMQPQSYNIKPALDSSQWTVSAKSFTADASRILHIVENPLTNELFGNPRIERIYNLTDDLLKIAGGTAETFWLTANKGMQIDVDKEMELTAEDEKNLTDEIDDYTHQLRRVLRTRGVKINPLGSDVPNPQEAFNMTLALISGATGIPQRILLGSEAGQLASGQDRNNWAERIMERRANFGEPQVIRPLIAKLTAAGILPDIDQTLVMIAWPDAFALPPLEQAQVSAQSARSAVNMAKATNSVTLFDEDEARKICGLLPRKGKPELPTQPKPAKESGNAAATDSNQKGDPVDN